MLKILSFISVITWAPFASAATFSLHCLSPGGFVSQNRSPMATVHAEYEPLAFGHARLNYRLDYTVDCAEGGACWAQGSGQEAGVVADRSYRPTRYKDHVRFPLTAAGEKRSLILPAALQETAIRVNGYLQLDGVQNIYGTTVPLACEVTAVKKTEPSATAEEALQQADQIIQKNYGLPSLRLKADSMLLQQALDALGHDAVTLSQATGLAMAEILDDFEAYESPLNVAVDGETETGEQKDKARRILRQELNQTATTLSLYLGKTVRGENYPPEMGEDAAANWIFVLRIPSLSDHIYWVVVDKTGDKAPYLYGFN